MQYLKVRFDGAAENKTYTYQWSGWPQGRAIQEGERVCVPPNWANTEPQLATVVETSIRRDPGGYQGVLAEIMGYVLDGEVIGLDERLP